MTPRLLAAVALGFVVSVRAGARAEEEPPIPPNVKGELVLVLGNGERLSYAAWPEAKRKRLAELYQKIAKGEKDLGLALPSVGNIQKNSNKAYYTEAQAHDVWLAHVAHCLWVNEKKLVPWKLEDDTPAELAALFDGAHFHARIAKSQNTGYPTGIEPGRDFQEAPEHEALGELDGDPRTAYDFVTGKTSASRKSLVGKDQLETLANLTVWMRDDCEHGKIPGNTNPSHAWIQDRLRAAPGQKVALANFGCHSASKLIVDLARSVNIPLLHVRCQENDKTDCHFFNRTHGGLVFGQGGSHLRVLWHTDEIYAMPGEPCFPVDKQGKLLDHEAATRAYFDARWVLPGVLEKAGFVFKIERVVPEKGFGVTSAGAYEDRADFGTMGGYWKTKGKSNLAAIMRAEQEYATGGQFLVDLESSNIVEAQLTTLRKEWQGDFAANELPPMHAIAEFEERAKLVMKALGGDAGYKKVLAAYEKERGSNLLR